MYHKMRSSLLSRHKVLLKYKRVKRQTAKKDKQQCYLPVTKHGEQYSTESHQKASRCLLSCFAIKTSPLQHRTEAQETQREKAIVVRCRFDPTIILRFHN